MRLWNHGAHHGDCPRLCQELKKQHAVLGWGGCLPLYPTSRMLKVHAEKGSSLLLEHLFAPHSKPGELPGPQCGPQFAAVGGSLARALRRGWQ